MLRWKPQITDQILMSLGRQNGPAVNNIPQRIIASEQAKEFAQQKEDQDYADEMQLRRDAMNQNMGLATRRLEQQGEQFGQSLDFNKERFGKNLGFNKQVFNANLGLTKDANQFARRQGNVANILSLAGLGVEGVGAYQDRQREQEIDAFRKDLIKKYKSQGSASSDFYARLIELMG